MSSDHEKPRFVTTLHRLLPMSRHYLEMPSYVTNRSASITKTAAWIGKEIPLDELAKPDPSNNHFPEPRPSAREFIRPFEKQEGENLINANRQAVKKNLEFKTTGENVRPEEKNVS